MTHFPPSELHQRRRLLLRRIGIALSALMVLTMLTILGLIVRTERAHDDQTCPFTELSERSFAGGRVLEEARSCLPGLSERRYLVERPGQPVQELVRKRLSSERFAASRYRWELATDAQERVLLRVFTDGKLASEFREEARRP